MDLLDIQYFLIYPWILRLQDEMNMKKREEFWINRPEFEKFFNMLLELNAEWATAIVHSMAIMILCSEQSTSIPCPPVMGLNPFHPC
jgi:hypothetical protein